MASRSLGQLTIDLIAKVGGFVSGMTQAERAADKSARKLKSTFSGIKNAVTAAFAFVGAGLLVREIVKNTAEAEKAFALLDNAVKQSGGAAGFTTDQLVELSAELQKTTTFSDEAVQGAEQLLLRFQHIQGVNFKGAVTAALDLSTALGKDLQSAALLVGKALENPEKGMKALTKAGIVLEKSQEDLIKRLASTGHASEAQALLLKELEKRYGGAAAAARNTFGGAIEGLKNAFGDLLEAKGGVPEAVDAINELTDTLSSPEVKAGIASLVSGIITIIGVLAQATASISGFAKYVGETFAAFNTGPAEGDLVRISDKIVELQDEVKRLKDLGGIGTALHGGADVVKNELADYEKQISELQAKLKAGQDAAVRAQTPAGVPGGAVPGTPAVAPPSEEFLKIKQHLEEQIALYGKTGEAAKLAAQISSGAIEGMSKAEQQELLALAASYDALGNSVGHVLTREEELAKAVNDSTIELQKMVNESLDSFGKDYEDTTKILVEATGTMWEDTSNQLTKHFEEASEFMKEASRNVTDILATGFEDAMNGSFDNILKSFEQMIEKMVAQALAADVGEKLFGKEGVGGGGGLIGKGIDWLSSIFGKAGGGPVNAGHLYRVNEQGMESLSIPGKADYLMMGGESGSINPAGSSAGGSRVTQNIYVTGSVSERTARQISIESVRRQRAIMRLA